MFKKLTSYIKNSIVELKRVNWPTKDEAIKNTILVVVICLAMAAFLGVIDFILTQILQIVI